MGKTIRIQAHKNGKRIKPGWDIKLEKNLNWTGALRNAKKEEEEAHHWGMRGLPQWNISSDKVIFKGHGWHRFPPPSLILPPPPPLYILSSPIFLSLLWRGAVCSIPNYSPLCTSTLKTSTTTHISTHPHQYLFLYLYISQPLPCGILHPTPTHTTHLLQ